MTVRRHEALLILDLEARSHSGELRIAPAANDARIGAHDDLVLSVAITLSIAARGPWTMIEQLRT